MAHPDLTTLLVTASDRDCIVTLRQYVHDRSQWSAFVIHWPSRHEAKATAIGPVAALELALSRLDPDRCINPNPAWLTDFRQPADSIPTLANLLNLPKVAVGTLIKRRI